MGKTKKLKECSMRSIFYVWLIFLVPVFNIQCACVTGSFQQVSGSPFSAGTGSYSAAFSPLFEGKLFLAVSNNSANSVSMFLVDQSTGNLTEVSGSPFFLTGTGPTELAFSPVVSGGLVLAVINSDNTVSVFLVDASGSLSPVVGSPFSAPTTPFSIAFSPLVSGNLFAAITGATHGDIWTFVVNQTTGVFSAPTILNTGGPVTGIAYSPLVSNNLFAATVIPVFLPGVIDYLVNQTTGALSAVDGVVSGTTASLFVAFSPVTNSNSLFFAVSNPSPDNNVSVYSLNSLTGSFSQISGSPFAAGVNPYGVAFSPIASNLLFAAVSNRVDNTISAYSVDQTTGEFVAVTGSPFSAGTTPQGLTFSPLASNNLFAAVANHGSNNVSVYKVCLPTSPTPPTPVPESIIQSPRALNVYARSDIFLTQIDLINVVTWQAPITGPTPTRYIIYRNAALTDFAGIVKASSSLQFIDHDICPNIPYSYYIVAANDTLISQAASITFVHTF